MESYKKLSRHKWIDAFYISKIGEKNGLYNLYIKNFSGKIFRYMYIPEKLIVEFNKTYYLGKNIKKYEDKFNSDELEDMADYNYVYDVFKKYEVKNINNPDDILESIENTIIDFKKDIQELILYVFENHKNTSITVKNFLVIYCSIKDHPENNSAAINIIYQIINNVSIPKFMLNTYTEISNINTDNYKIKKKIAYINDKEVYNNDNIKKIFDIEKEILDGVFK